MTDQQKSAGEAPKVEAPVEPRVKAPGISIGDNLKWGLAIAGLAGGALIFYFRNQIGDGVKKLMGKETELEKKQNLIQSVAIEAPSEFLSPDERAGVDVGKEPVVEYDSVHAPMTAEDEAILGVMNREARKESDHLPKSLPFTEDLQ